MKSIKFKRYKIVYAPRIKIEQLSVNPLDDWDTANIDGKYVLVQVANHDNRNTETVYIEAPNRESAKALFAVAMFCKIPLGKPCDFDSDILVIDAINHIVEITEVSE